MNRVNTSITHNISIDERAKDPGQHIHYFYVVYSSIVFRNNNRAENQDTNRMNDVSLPQCPMTPLARLDECLYSSSRRQQRLRIKQRSFSAFLYMMIIGISISRMNTVVAETSTISNLGECWNKVNPNFKYTRKIHCGLTSFLLS